MIIAAILASLFAFGHEDAAFVRQTAEAFVSECPSRESGSPESAKAADWIFSRLSVSDLAVRQSKFSAESVGDSRMYVNVYAEYERNPKAPWIVLVSHFDTKPGIECPGANDGASTSALLLAFARRLAESRDERANVMLLWTDGEECRGKRYRKNDGLQGSRQAAKELKRSGREVLAVICLDMLGDKDLNITLPVNGSPSLSFCARRAAKRLGEENLIFFGLDRVTDDHVPFLEEGYLAIDLIDFDYGPDNAWWHTKEDTIDKVSVESLERSGRLVAELVEELL